MARNGFGLQFVNSESNRKTFKEKRRPLIRLTSGGTSPSESFFNFKSLTVNFKEEQSSQMSTANLMKVIGFYGVIALLLDTLCEIVSS